MHEYEKTQRRAEQTPAWRTSGGRMWERDPVARKEGRDHLTGYEPHPDREKRDQPREAARLSGAYGDVAVGVSRKKELTLVVSKRRSGKGEAATRDEQALRARGARKMERQRGDFRTNPHDPKRSAVAFRTPARPAPSRMLGRFQGMMDRREQELLAEQTPFLNPKPERAELKALGERAEDLRARGGAEGRAELDAVERRRQELRQVLTEKETQTRKVRLLLQKAREDAKRRAGESEPPRRFLLLTPQTDGAEPPPEGEEDSSDEKKEEI